MRVGPGNPAPLLEPPQHHSTGNPTASNWSSKRKKVQNPFEKSIKKMNTLKTLNPTSNFIIKPPATPPKISYTCCTAFITVPGSEFRGTPNICDKRPFRTLLIRPYMQMSALHPKASAVCIDLMVRAAFCLSTVFLHLSVTHTCWPFATATAIINRRLACDPWKGHSLINWVPEC